MPIRPTPEICEIFGSRMFSAKASTVVSGSESEVRASTRIGVSAGFTLRMVGG